MLNIYIQDAPEVYPSPTRRMYKLPQIVSYEVIVKVWHPHSARQRNYTSSGITKTVKPILSLKLSKVERGLVPVWVSIEDSGHVRLAFRSNPVYL